MVKIQKYITALFIGVVLVATLFFYRGKIFGSFRFPGDIIPEKVTSDNFEVVADNLEIPWEIAFLPDGEMLVPERPGNLKRIGKEGRTYKVDGVEHRGEGGLLGMALHPQFSINHWVYLYLTT